MITHDRWPRIKEIFFSAQERTPAERAEFLHKVCGDDASMRKELEELLTADASNEDFLTSPAYEFAQGMLFSEGSEFKAGQKVGRFEILCSLGAGGMGQIYLARDALLSRNIALKLISQEFATDPRRVVRFEQEARAASALNHPNVCVIHEIGITDNGRHFIAMEYIQGVTLRDHLAGGPLKLVDGLQVAIQVGRALATAHAVGIVHRDIKPENIMLRPDGYVKVVDFGLAKLTEALPEQRRLINEVQTVVKTEPRTLMGTVKYMSPEQLREMPLDERTDIWSLGVVLYEMLTGSTPFDARSPNDSVALILAPERAKLFFPEEIPIQYREIVKKALAKDCDERYQTITKLTADLSNLKRELERRTEDNSVPDIKSSPELYTHIGKQHTRMGQFGSAILTRLKSQAILTADSLVTEIRTHKAAALFASVFSVIALFVGQEAVRRLNKVDFPLSSSQQTARVDQRRIVKPLTNAGTSVSSAISSNGILLAHAELKNGKQQLTVTNITNTIPSVVIPPDAVEYLGISFSRDNNYIYFTRREKDGSGILYQLAWPGTNPIKLKTGVDSPISFSPEGDRFAFVRNNRTTSEYSLMLSNIDGTNEQVIATRKDGSRFSAYGPAWSPDGNVVACAASYWDKGYHMNLVGFDLRNRNEQVIGGKKWASILKAAWHEDMSSLIISARERDTAPHQLWRVSYPDGAIEQITSDSDDYTDISISGKNIVTVQADVQWRLWVSSLDEPQKPTAIESGVGLNYGLSWTTKDKIVFSSMVQDRLHISRIDPDGSNKIQLTFVGDNYTPASSLDGKFIVFASNRTGPFNIWRMNADDGSDPTQLTFTDANFYPAVSPDSQWVAYDDQVKTKMNIWKVPMAGGDPINVGENYRMPVFSPDNELIAGRYNFESGSRDVAIFPAQGGRPLKHFAIPVQPWQRLQWLPNGRELTYLKNENGYSNIWSYDLDTGESKQLTYFNSDLIYAYAWSPDYKKVACQRGTMISNVTMISER